MSEHTVVRAPVDDAVPTPPTSPPESGPGAGRYVLGGLLILAGVLLLLDAAAVTDLRWQVALPAALTAVGVALLATARRGAHGGLVAAGIVLSLLVFASSVAPSSVPMPFLSGVGDRIERPASLPEAGVEYELGVGKLTVDLRDVDVPAGGGEIVASVGMGELVIRLPEGLGADVRANAGMGEVVLRGGSRGGVGVSVAEELPGRPTVVLDLSVGMGKVEVGR